MTDDEEDEKDKRIDAAGKAIGDALHELSDALADLNTAFPATKEFLRLCGASHVKELTPEQMTQLKAYLEAELAALNGTGKPSN